MEKRNGYFKKIDFVFFNAAKIREAVTDAKYGPMEHGVNGSGVGDPTATQAIHNIMPVRFIRVEGNQLEWPEAWLHVYDMVRAMCDAIELDVMQAHYGDENYKKTCRRLNIAQATHSRLWGQVRHYQELCAVQEGLIRVF